MRKKMDQADLKKRQTNVFGIFKHSEAYRAGQQRCPPPPLPPAPQKMRRGTQTTVTSATVTATTPPPIKEYTYEPAKQEPVEEEYDDVEDYHEDDN